MTNKKYITRRTLPEILVTCAAMTLFGLAASARLIFQREAPPPEKPIDSLITAAGIYRHDLAIMDLATREITWITDDDTVEQEPCWSPDGKHILYSAIDDAWHELRILNLETGEMKTLLAEEGVSFVGPQWNAEGKVVFTRRSRPAVLCVGNIVETGIIDVDCTDAIGYNPVWGPDGKIFFTGLTKDYKNAELDPTNGFLAKLEIYSLLPDENGGYEESLYNPLSQYATCQPRFSRDWKKMAFGAHRLGFNDIYVLETNSGKIDRITNNKFEDRDAVWSPNADDLYFVSDRNGVFQLFYRDKDGNEKQLTHNKGFDILNPAFSPDGKKLAIKTITPISPDEKSDSSSEPHPHFRGKCFTINYTDLTPHSSPRSWLRPFFTGTLSLGAQGELLYTGQQYADSLVAYKFNEQLELFEQNTLLEHRYCAIGKDGKIHVDALALANFVLKASEVPVYNHWPFGKLGNPELPNKPTMILPNSVGVVDVDPQPDGWAIELYDGSWLGCPHKSKPTTHSVLFYYEEGGTLSVKKNTPDGFRAVVRVSRELAAEAISDTMETPFQTKIWPYAIGKDGFPMPPGAGDRFDPWVEKPMWIMAPSNGATFPQWEVVQ